MDERRGYKGDLPGSRSGPCLGCGKRVVTGRDSHVLIGGKRDGSALIFTEVKPLLAYTTDVDRLLEPGMVLLGHAHRGCIDHARKRLEDRQVSLPAALPQLIVEEVGDDEDPLPALHLPPQGDACAFCGVRELSEEHIWPAWISRLITSVVPSDRPFRIGPSDKPRSSTTLDVTAPICVTCNNRWLSVIENDVRPVLAPMVKGVEKQSLSVKEQERLATWAVKTALMIDLSNGAPVVPLGFYRDFRLRREPLSSHVVFLGAYSGSRLAAWATRQNLHIGIGGDEAPNGLVTTFTAFRVIFQVIGHFTVGGATLSDSRRVARGLWTIWPPQHKEIEWPRGGLAFSEESLRELAESVNCG